MWEDFKLLLVVCGIVGVFNMIKPPFMGFWKAVNKGLLSFLMGVLVGFALSYFDISEVTRCGFAGLSGMFSQQLYDCINKLIGNAPKIIEDKVKGDK